MGQSEAKLTRSALDAALIEQELLSLGQTSVHLEVRQSVGSTNDEVVPYLSALAEHNLVVMTADEQTAGRGRLDRSWSSPHAAGIALTMALPISQVSGELTSVPLRAGLAVQRALLSMDISVTVKWPNDIVSNQGHKVGGLLSVVRDQNVLVGIGLNVSLTHDELPTTTSTSLSILGHDVSREQLIARIVHEFYAAVSQAEWLSDYEKVSATLGQHVTLHRQGLPGVNGKVVSFAPDGSIVIDSEAGQQSFSIGDVEHLRPSEEI